MFLLLLMSMLVDDHLRECDCVMDVMVHGNQDVCMCVTKVRLFCENDSRGRTQSAVRETYS